MKYLQSLKATLLPCLMLITLPLVASQPNNDAQNQKVGVNITVVDTAGEPLIGATAQIIAKRNAAGVTVGGVTDANGVASLWVDKGTMVEIRCAGRTSAPIPLTQSGDLKVVLEENVSQPDQVSGTGYQHTAIPDSCRHSQLP